MANKGEPSELGLASHASEGLIEMSSLITIGNQFIDVAIKITIPRCNASQSRKTSFHATASTVIRHIPVQ